MVGTQLTLLQMVLLALNKPLQPQEITRSQFLRNRQDNHVLCMLGREQALA